MNTKLQLEIIRNSTEPEKIKFLRSRNLNVICEIEVIKLMHIRNYVEKWSVGLVKYISIEAQAALIDRLKPI